MSREGTLCKQKKRGGGVHFCVFRFYVVFFFSFLHIQRVCAAWVFFFFFPRICSTQFSYVSILRSIYIFIVSATTHATTEIQGTRGEQKTQNFCVAYQKSVSEVSLLDSKHYNGSGQASSLIREQC